MVEQHILGGGAFSGKDATKVAFLEALDAQMEYDEKYGEEE